MYGNKLDELKLGYQKAVEDIGILKEEDKGVYSLGVGIVINIRGYVYVVTENGFRDKNLLNNLLNDLKNNTQKCNAKVQILLEQLNTEISTQIERKMSGTFGATTGYLGIDGILIYGVSGYKYIPSDVNNIPGITVKELAELDMSIYKDMKEENYTKNIYMKYEKLLYKHIASNGKGLFSIKDIQNIYRGKYIEKNLKIRYILNKTELGIEIDNSESDCGYHELKFENILNKGELLQIPIYEGGVYQIYKVNGILKEDNFKTDALTFNKLKNVFDNIIYKYIKDTENSENNEISKKGIQI